VHRTILRPLAALTLLSFTWSALVAQAQALSRFDLPAQSLAESLRAVATQTDTNMLFDPPLVAGRQAPAIKGSLTLDQALTRLLAGTDIRHEFLNEKTVVLSAAPPSAPPGANQARGKANSSTDQHNAPGCASSDPPSTAATSQLRLAQTNAGGAPDPTQATRGASHNDEPPLEEITVTATKRSEALSKVPISISAYNREALQASGVKSVGDLAALTPGVEFDNSSGFGPGTLTNIAIRGINSSIGTSTTGIYVDDTPVQSRITALSYFGNPLPLMFDVDRVEVERGPQGTLFGAGAEGGALRFVSPEPGLTQYSGFVRSEFADTQDGAPSYEGGAAVGGPIIDNELGFRASAWYRRDGGYVDHVDPLTDTTVNPNSNWTDSYAVRGALAAAPADGVKISGSIYAQSVHNNDSSAYFDYLSNPANGDFRNGRLLSQPNTDRLFLPSLKVEADLGFAALTSVTSYVNRRGTLLDDNTSFTAATFGGSFSYGSPLGPEYPTSYDQAVPTSLRTSMNQISEEVRLASADPQARLRWTAGLYYSNARQFDGEQVTAPFIAANVFGAPGDTSFLDTSLSSTDKQYALFGQIDYRVIDKLTLTAGLRIARTDAAFTEAQAGLIAAPEFPTAQGDEKQTPVTPKMGLAYQLDDNNMVYVSVGKGYRVGGGNLPIPLASPTNPVGCPLAQEPGSYQSDSLWTYEIGAKDLLLGGRLQLDTSVFHTDWSNVQQQIFFPACGFGYTANTGRATVNGFDIGLAAAPIDALTLGLSLAYTDAWFTKSVSVNGMPVVQDGDVIGNPPNVAAPWSTTTSARYEFSLPGDRRVYMRAEDIFHSRNNGPFSSYNPQSTSYSPEIPPNPATNVVNLRAGVLWSTFDVSVFVNNACNSHPDLTRYQDTPFSTLFTNLTLRPRTVGVTAAYRF
jgi:iron complex outermembrane recepter protein